MYKHPAKYYRCSSKTVGGVSRTNHVPFVQLVRKNHVSISGRTNGQTDDRTDGWTIERTDERTNERTDERTDQRTYQRTNGRMDGRTNERADERTDGRTDRSRLICPSILCREGITSCFMLPTSTNTSLLLRRFFTL